MTIIHRAGNIHKNADGLSRWALPNTSDNPAYDPDDEINVPIMGIHTSDLDEEFYGLIREKYKLDKNSSIICNALKKDYKNEGLISQLEEPWKKGLIEGRFSLYDGLLYHRTKHSSVIVLTCREDITTILHECHDAVFSGHFSEDETCERVKLCAWWPNWKTDTQEYCRSCDKCQKANKQTGKRFGLLQKIEEPFKPWDIINMDWVTALSPGGNNSYNACLVVCELSFYRFHIYITTTLHNHS
jgi:hypothetical protein